MPPKRRKTTVNNETEELDVIYARIAELLLIVKPDLAQAAHNNAKDIIHTLHDIAKLAEAFITRKASESREVVAAFIDQLDTEGVSLWNSATYLRSTAPANLFAAVRYAGFRMIEAGLDANPSEEVLVHVLELSSKVGMAFATADAADAAIAEDVLNCAASYQHSLAEIPIEESPDAQSRARAIVLYYTSRMDAAWKQGNPDVAVYMMQQIENHQVEIMLPHDIELVAGKIMEIGKAIAKGGQSGGDETSPVERAVKSLTWMSRAFAIVDKRQKGWKSPELRRVILRNLARSYYISSAAIPENLDKAEEVLKELSSALEQADEREKGDEYQQLRWMSLAVFKKRNTSGEKLLAICKPLIENLILDEESLHDILLEVRSISKTHFHVATQSLEQLLFRTLQESEHHRFADKMLISLIMHMKVSPSHQDAITILTKALDAIVTSNDYDLERMPSTACLTILWQLGDQYYSQKLWENAADWFMLSTHPVFAVVADIAGSKCRRKAALCYIQNEQYAKAAAQAEQCSVNEAASCYLGFLIAAHQAIHHVGSMMKANDFDKKMLLMATNFAREAQSRPLLHSILEGLLKTLKTDAEADLHGQGLPIIRCLVRLVLQMTEEPGANLKKLIPLALEHFRTGNALVLDAIKQKKTLVVAKDLSWLWRTAYNTAVNGLNVWDDGDVTEMFLVARNLMEASSKASAIEPEPDLHESWIMASFSAISGQLFKARLQPESDEKTKRLRNIAADIERLFELAREMCSKDKQDQSATRLAAILHLSLVYQVEILSGIQDWDCLSMAVKTANNAITISIATHEAIADILWLDKTCPVAVLFGCLEATLRATTQQGALSIKKFSRWLRAICSILLSRGQGSDRNKAMAYMHQAIDVLRKHVLEDSGGLDIDYPEDERHWLISTAFNTGVEFASTLQIPEAREWFEVATVLCQFVKDSPRQRIEETYQDLLSRYPEEASRT